MNHSKYINDVLYTYVRNKSCSFVSFNELAHLLQDCRETHSTLCTSCRQRSPKDMWKRADEEKPATATKKFLAPEKK